MDLLSEEEFKTSCDSMNFVNMVDSTEDLTGRYVKIHLQLTNHKIFASEESKRNRLGTFADIYSINDNVWYSRLYIERTDTYSSEPILLYFTNKNADTIEHLKTDNEIMVYGVVLDYELNDGFHNEFDFLAVYIEKI